MISPGLIWRVEDDEQKTGYLIASYIWVLAVASRHPGLFSEWPFNDYDHQYKYYEVSEVTQDLFNKERKKAALDEDFFIHYRQRPQYQL